MTFDDDPLPKMESFARKDLKKWITKLKKKLTLEDQPADSEKIEIIPKFGFNRYVRTTMLIKRINEELARREKLDKTPKSGKKDAKVDKVLPVKESAKPADIIIPALEGVQIEQEEEPNTVKRFRTSEVDRVVTRSMMRKLEKLPMSPLTPRTSEVFSFPSPKEIVETPPGPSGIRDSKLKPREPIFFNIEFTTNQESRIIESFKINRMTTRSMMKKEKEASTVPFTPQIPRKDSTLRPQDEKLKIGESMLTSSCRVSPGSSGISNYEMKMAQGPSTAKVVDTLENCRVATRGMMKKEGQVFTSPSTSQTPRRVSSLHTPEEPVRTRESMPKSTKRNSPGTSGTRNPGTEPTFFDISFKINQESRIVEAFKINKYATLSMMKKGEYVPVSSPTSMNHQDVSSLHPQTENMRIGESMSMSTEENCPGTSGIRNSELESVEDQSTAKLSETLENCRVTTRSMMNKEKQAVTSPPTPKIPQKAAALRPQKEKVPVESRNSPGDSRSVTTDAQIETAWANRLRNPPK
ncbi:hypothetical protein CAEBREN_04609 [Caenorhabditis brenneri]|uniref:Uncharacterized protein n=1 Tax=Caenorhabditis brenneri TaxID=135651 RepID=G0MBG1_CAEBE|nr:hypothetical protein CAEBREN_04609 [Caenorhabditis brenneri]